MHINPNTFDIFNALRKAAFSKKAFVMPEILRHYAVAREDVEIFDSQRAGWNHE